MKKLYLILTVFISLHISCKKEKELIAVSNAPINKAPVAVAGDDRIIDLPQDSVFLDGKSSVDPDGKIVAWKWEMIFGLPSARILDVRLAKTPVFFTESGSYLFELTVTDNGGLSSKDTVKVIVNPRKNQTSEFIQGGNGNLIFYFPDPTASMSTEDVGALTFGPSLNLVVVKIDQYPNGVINGIWAHKSAPRCPISTDYFVEPDNYVSYGLTPGTYTWTAETVYQNFKGYPLGSPSFTDNIINFFAKPHKTTGTVTIQPNETCLVQKIVF